MGGPDQLGDPWREVEPSEETLRAFAAYERAYHSGSEHDLRRAIAAIRDRLRRVRPNSPETPELFLQLSELSRARYEHHGQRRRDLARAVSSGRAAVGLAPADHPLLASYQSVLGVVLWLRYVRIGDRRALDEALVQLRSAVGSVAADHPLRARFMSDLARAVDSHYRLTGNLDSRDEAIRIMRAVLEYRPTIEAATQLSNLAVSLRRRFEDVRQVSDIRESVDLFREAVAAAGTEYRHRAALLANYSLALRRLYESQDAEQSTDVLDEAVTMAREAVSAAATDREIRPMALTNLAGALHARSMTTKDVTGLEEAVEVARRSLLATRRRDPARPRRAAQVARLLANKCELTGESDGLTEAVGCLAYAARRTKGRPESATFLVALGRTLNLVARHRAELGHRRLFMKAARRSVEACRRAAAVRGAPSHIHVQAALNWAVFAEILELPDAEDGFEAYVAGLPLVGWLAVRRSDRERALAEVVSEVGRVGAHFIGKGDAARAVTLLDRCRGILWSRTLNLRSDLTELAAKHPECAARLAEIRTELDRDFL